MNLDPILPKIEAYLAATGMTATRFGLEAARDSQLVFQLREGRELRRRTRARIRAWLDAHAGNSSEHLKRGRP